jgi:hypothetical protein
VKGDSSYEKHRTTRRDTQALAYFEMAKILIGPHVLFSKKKRHSAEYLAYMNLDPRGVFALAYETGQRLDNGISGGLKKERNRDTILVASVNDTMKCRLVLVVGQGVHNVPNIDHI